MKNRKISALETAIISILSLCLLIYELGFCNWNALANKTYNFSLFRTIIYIVCIILYSKFSKSFIEEAEKVIKYKKKKRKIIKNVHNVTEVWYNLPCSYQRSAWI